MTSLLEPYQLFYRHRHVLLDSVKHGLRIRHAGSVLGTAWLILGPLILLSLYAVLYTFVFQVKPVRLSISDYILYIFSGLIPFISFSQALAAGSTALTANPALLLNRVFPAELIPAREVLTAGIFMAVGGGLTLTYKAATGGMTWAWLLLPVIVVLMAMATCGLAWGLSLANLVFKDVQQIVGYVIIIILVASPIAYTPDMVPPMFKILLYLNPFAYYVSSFQSILVLGEVPSPQILLGCIVFALISFHGMYRVFSLGKAIIADHI